MRKVNRRTFFSSSLLAAAGVSLHGSILAKTDKAPHLRSDPESEGPNLIDTNINLMEWPFRKLKYGNTESLVAKLRKHRVAQAWAGSFEALFHKDIDGVNFRLAEECNKQGKGMLIPFGTVNLAWTDWKEDLRRCQELYKMPGVRIYPSYQTFGLDHPDFPHLVQAVNKRKMILQIVGDMDDSRNHHPIVITRDANLEPLAEVLKKEPGAKIQMLYWNHQINLDLLKKLVLETSTVFDISRIETSGGVGRQIDGKPWGGSPSTPIPVERLLFGSHAPYFPIETNILKLLESPLNTTQAKAIMEGNARRLMGNG